MTLHNNAEQIIISTTSNNGETNEIYISENNKQVIAAKRYIIKYGILFNAKDKYLLRSYIISTYARINIPYLFLKNEAVRFITNSF